MLKLRDANLEPSAQATLLKWQEEIDEEPSFAQRVSAAKSRFNARNRNENPTFRAVRVALKAACANVLRCNYCEVSEADEVEHVLPKDLYPEKVFTWSNYVYSCGVCNRKKSNRFWIIAEAGGRVKEVTRRRGEPMVPPEPGERCFIDPRSEDPLDYLFLDTFSTFMFSPRDETNYELREKAKRTIEVIDLNRECLLAARLAAFKAYAGLLSEYRKLKEEDADLEELEVKAEAILSQPHPAVWESMKLHSRLNPKIVGLFAACPEALTWGL